MSLMVTFMHIRFVNYREKTEEKQQVRPRHRFSGTRAKKKQKTQKNIMVQRNEAVYLKRSYGLKCYICIIVFLCFCVLLVLSFFVCFKD